MGLLQPNPANTLNPDRTPEFPLTSTKSGGVNQPIEFQESTDMVTVTQTGQSIGESITEANPPQGLLSSELQQDKTQERKLVQVSASFVGLHLVQQVTDPTYGISALVDKSIQSTLGGVDTVTLTDGGSAYTDQTTVTSPAPPDGLAAKYVPTIVAGVITLITITDPGSGHWAAPIITINDPGGGSGATATATIPTPKINGSPIESATVGVGGSGYTSATTITVPAPTGGDAAILSAVISGGVITGITIVSRGSGYITAPAVTIADTGGGTDATATVTLGWVTYYDLTPLQKWQSIQIATKIDLNTLPAQLTMPKEQRLGLPDVLAAISGQWSSEKGISQTNNVNPAGLAGTAHCTCDGGINVEIVSGFRGWCKGAFVRKFFSALPQQSDLPTPTIITPSLGTVVVNAKGNSISASFTLNSASGSYSGMIRAHSIAIGPVLTNGVSLSAGTFSDSQNASASTSGSQLVASYNITANASALATLSMPTSTPTSFSSGNVIYLDGDVSQWRFGIFVLEYNYAIHP